MNNSTLQVESPSTLYKTEFSAAVTNQTAWDKILTVIDGVFGTHKSRRGRFEGYVAALNGIASGDEKPVMDFLNTYQSQGEMFFHDIVDAAITHAREELLTNILGIVFDWDSKILVAHTPYMIRLPASFSAERAGFLVRNIDLNGMMDNLLTLKPGQKEFPWESIDALLPHVSPEKSAAAQSLFDLMVEKNTSLPFRVKNLSLPPASATQSPSLDGLSKLSVTDETLQGAIPSIDPAPISTPKSEEKPVVEATSPNPPATSDVPPRRPLNRRPRHC